MDHQFNIKRLFYCSVSNLGSIFDKNGTKPFFIDFIYRIDHLLCFTLEFDNSEPPLSTERFDKFIKFRTVNYRLKKN